MTDVSTVKLQVLFVVASKTMPVIVRDAKGELETIVRERDRLRQENAELHKQIGKQEYEKNYQAHLAKSDEAKL